VSALAEEQVENPAATDVRTGATAMAEDVAVGAAGVFEGVGEDGEAVKVTIGVNLLSQCNGGNRLTSGLEAVGMNRAEKVTKILRLQDVLPTDHGTIILEDPHKAVGRPRRNVKSTADVALSSEPFDVAVTQKGKWLQQRSPG
jgi:hypothetical protein